MVIKAPVGVKKEGVSNFLGTMVSSANDRPQEVKPQTTFTNVNEQEIEKVMANLKKGIIRRY